MIGGIDSKAARPGSTPNSLPSAPTGFGALQLAEKYVGGILPHDLFAALAVSLEPARQRAHGDFIGGEQSPSRSGSGRWSYRGAHSCRRSAARMIDPSVSFDTT